MARLTKAQREWRPGMPKKRRSVRTMFASVILTLEAFVAFFATLVLFGLRGRELGAGLVLGVGLGLVALFILTCAVVSKQWGLWMGWALQLVLVALGFLEPMMFLVGGVVALTWWYALRTGARLDRENAQREKEQAEWERTHPEAAVDGPGGAASGPAAQ